MSISDILCVFAVFTHVCQYFVITGDGCGRTPLMFACQQGNAYVVALLLACGASVNVCEAKYQHTPLMMAARYGQLAPLLMCLRTGIVEGRVEYPLLTLTHTPLLSIYFIFHAGAIIDAFDENGRTAFHLACKRGQTSTCALLLALCHPTAANDLPLPEHSTMVVPLGPGEAELFTPRTLLKSGVSVLIL